MRDYYYEWSVEKPSKCEWMYANLIFPMNTLFLNTNDDIQLLLRAFTDGPCKFDPDCCEATTGSSGIGGWEEGDIDFSDINGRRRTLSYDYVPVDDTWETGRVFRYVVFDND